MIVVAVSSAILLSTHHNIRFSLYQIQIVHGLQLSWSYGQRDLSLCEFCEER